MKYLIVLLACIFFIGCTTIPTEGSPESNLEGISTASLAKTTCWTLCKQAQTNQLNLENGPCLSDTMEFPVNDWVCDIAHNPRTEIDNVRENQCTAFHNNTARHFVEYTPECEFIIQE